MNTLSNLDNSDSDKELSESELHDNVLMSGAAEMLLNSKASENF